MLMVTKKTGKDCEESVKSTKGNATNKYLAYTGWTEKFIFKTSNKIFSAAHSGKSTIDEEKIQKCKKNKFRKLWRWRKPKFENIYNFFK